MHHGFTFEFCHSGEAAVILYAHSTDSLLLFLFYFIFFASALKIKDWSHHTFHGIV
jgi:hypothetical protein